MSPAHVPSPADRETGLSFPRAAGPAWRDHGPQYGLCERQAVTSLRRWYVAPTAS